jgi:hypothetical protein
VPGTHVSKEINAIAMRRQFKSDFKNAN